LSALAKLLLGDKNNRGFGDNWSSKRCKAAVKWSPIKTNTQCFTGQMSFLSPNQQCQSMDGKIITFHGLDQPKLTWGSSNLVIDNLGLLQFPWGGIPSPSSGL